MVDFKPAFEKMMSNEGGYIVHTIEGDSGGMTYAGISRKFHPNWLGWQIIDNAMSGSSENYFSIETLELKKMVQEFYEENYWDSMHCGDLNNQENAEAIFDFGVNAGIRVASRLAQIVAHVTPDGYIGPKSIFAIDSIDSNTFITGYCVAKIARYATICNSNKSQSKFLLGWINRSLKGVL